MKAWQNLQGERVNLAAWFSKHLDMTRYDFQHNIQI